MNLAFQVFGPIWGRTPQTFIFCTMNMVNYALPTTPTTEGFLRDILEKNPYLRL